MKPNYISLEHLLVAVAYGLRSHQADSLPGTPPAKVLLSRQILEPQYLGELLIRLAVYSSVPVFDGRNIESQDNDWIMSCIEDVHVLFPESCLEYPDGSVPWDCRFNLLDIIHSEARKISSDFPVWAKEIHKKHFVYEDVPVCPRIDPLVLYDFGNAKYGLGLGRVVYREYFGAVATMCNRLVADIQQHNFLVISQRDPGAFAHVA